VLGLEKSTGNSMLYKKDKENIILDKSRIIFIY